MTVIDDTTVRRPAFLYVSVTLPDNTVVPTDVAPTLKRESLPMTVDGLKEAVLKKLFIALVGKTVRHLTVYPPSKTPPQKDSMPYGTGNSVGDIDTPLSDTELKEPYHVVVS